MGNVLVNIARKQATDWLGHVIAALGCVALTVAAAGLLTGVWG